MSTGQGILGNNMLIYCLNNPVNKYDHLGEIAVTVDMRLGAVGSFILAMPILDMAISLRFVSHIQSIKEKNIDVDINPEDVNWNKEDKNHVIKGTGKTHIEGWKRLGMDQYNGKWEYFVPLFKDVIVNADHYEVQTVLTGQTISFYKTYIEEGVNLMVKIWISMDGEIIKLSDVVPYIINK